MPAPEVSSDSMLKIAEPLQIADVHIDEDNKAVIAKSSTFAS